MNATILTLTIFGNAEDVWEVIRHTHASEECRRFNKCFTQMYANRRHGRKHEDEEFRDAHAAVVAYAQELAHWRGCWSYNASRPANWLDVTACSILATADRMRQAIRTFRRANA